MARIVPKRGWIKRVEAAAEPSTLASPWNQNRYATAVDIIPIQAMLSHATRPKECQPVVAISQAATGVQKIILMTIDAAVINKGECFSRSTFPRMVYNASMS